LSVLALSENSEEKHRADYQQKVLLKNNLKNSV
jgi:hypothetical protein